MSTVLFWYGGWGFVVLRVILGALFISHGWPKTKNLRQTAQNFSGMGFKPGWLWGTIAALLELIGGVGIVLGLGMPWICALLLGQFAVIIIWKWIRKMPFVGGWEMDALIFAILLMFFTLYRGFFFL